MFFPGNSKITLDSSSTNIVCNAIEISGNHIYLIRCSAFRQSFTLKTSILVNLYLKRNDKYLHGNKRVYLVNELQNTPTIRVIVNVPMAMCFSPPNENSVWNDMIRMSSFVCCYSNVYIRWVVVSFLCSTQCLVLGDIDS